MKKPLALIALLIILSTSQVDAKEDNQAYLCTTDKMVGFAYNKESTTWVTANFTTGKNAQYTLSKWPDDGSLPINWAFTEGKPPWDLWDFEKKGLRLGCIESEKEIYCSYFDTFSDYFRMDKDTKKFVRSHSGDYISDIENPNMPMVSIGACSKVGL